MYFLFLYISVHYMSVSILEWASFKKKLFFSSSGAAVLLRLRGIATFSIAILISTIAWGNDSGFILDNYYELIGKKRKLCLLLNFVIENREIITT